MTSANRLSYADRQRSYERRQIESGARRMPSGLLPVDAARALDALIRAGYADSLTGCIARALIEARKRNR
ncbi:MAG: hypothetical protein L0H83_13465 [Salinisphaera sp.]|nr:hypothetical protein [Salinisphaera sp.]